jgi:hypothetical protein
LAAASGRAVCVRHAPRWVTIDRLRRLGVEVADATVDVSVPGSANLRWHG